MTINNSTGTHNATACGSYIWATNSTTYTSSGTYTAILTNSAGCDSLVTLNLTINPIPVLTTSVNNETITADETGSTYQWINCAGNIAITGETNQTYSATENGNYAVVVTNNNCSDTSACVNVISVGLNRFESINSQFEVFPNPNNGTFSLRTNNSELGTISITNTLGELVYFEIIKSANAEINISEFGSGIYFITLTSVNKRYIKRLVVL